jgi:hypothetical protein
MCGLIPHFEKGSEGGFKISTAIESYELLSNILNPS